MDKAPETVGIIMDGNRRFAKASGEAVSWGHKQGFATFKKIMEAADKAGVRHLIAYCFSSENWKRPKEEVAALLSLLKEALLEAKEKMPSVGSVKFIGDRTRFPKGLQVLMDQVEEKTRNRPGLSLALALSYGGRDEIIRAVKKIVSVGGEEVSEETIRKTLDTKDTPYPDMIIRTGGEMRLSNFLLWQSAYSELFFTKTLWPAFTKDEFLDILGEYGKRKRNFGA